MKSIKTKIILVIVILVAVSSVGLGALGVIMNTQSAMGSLESSMDELANISADRIYYQIKAYENVAIEAGTNSVLASETATPEQKRAVLDQYVSSFGMTRGNITDKNGQSIDNDTNIGDRDYFKQIMNGETVISDPVVSTQTGKISYIIGAPVWKNGVAGSQVIGAVYFVPEENFLNEIVSSISVGQSGYAYLINQEGTVIAHKDSSLVMTENSIQKAETDPALKDIAALEAKAVAGETGFGSYTWQGVSKVVSYAPIPEMNGWSVCVTADQSEFMSATNTALVITLVIVACMIVAGILIAIRVGNSVGRPIKACSDRLALMVEGDLTTEIPQTNSKDELHVLTQASNELVKEINKIIMDIGYLLGEMAEGNFDIRSTTYESYIGDFEPILLSIRKLNRNLSNTMRQINESADQVSNGASQVAQGSQALAQGATEQASSVQELSASINMIANQVNENAKNASEVNSIVAQVGAKLNECHQQMTEMVGAMGDISDASVEIGKIIKAIEDIAFQTNILALNAAVEAARAGEAGKGFAVVADEVRNLASKSSEAAKNTTQLIEHSIQTVEVGQTLANQTAQSLTEVVSGAEKVSENVEKIARANEEQATAADQISQGVEQISAVVQNNSATAEQSAAASEELSGQAEILNGLVAKFQLRRDDDYVRESGGPKVPSSANSEETIQIDMGDKY